jgi:hypothetical protein
MKSFLFLIPFFTSISLLGQYDTAILYRIVRHLKTDIFKKELIQNVDKEIAESIRDYPAIRKRAKGYRSDVYQRRDFWLSDIQCFILDSLVTTPVLSSKVIRESDSLYYLQYDTLFDVKKYHADISTCTETVLIEAKFLSPSVVEIGHYEGGFINGKRKFEELNKIRFQIIGDKIVILFLNSIFYG